MKISVVIISKTEVINEIVINSVKFAEEIIIIVDSEKKESKKIGEKRIFYRPLNDDFASQRNYALNFVNTDWVLFIDSDEYVGTELSKEILAISESTPISGFYLKRVDVCFHQQILHGETGQTKLLRLAKKSAGQFIRPVHEVWKINGKIGELSSPLYHNKNSFVNEFIPRMTAYSKIDAVILKEENKPFSYWRLFFNPKAKFVLNYFFRLGFLDGSVGLFMAYFMSVQSLSVRVLQWTKRN